MKKSLFLLLIIGCFFSKGQALDRSFENADGSLKLLGQVTVDRLSSEPFNGWFEKNHSYYMVNQNDLNKDLLPDSITVFMGTWCGDSRREVPRFIKILQSNNYDLNKLKIICLNSGFQNYKQAPEREEKGVNIHRVPTFIFHNNDGSEIGRIVEEPVTNLEQDMSAILSGDEYQTAYPLAEKMVSYFDQYPLKELKKRKTKLLTEFSEAENPYELNTYGYVLWSSFQLPKAQFLFELNAELFPDETTPHRTLASFLNALGKEKEALVSVKKGLKIDPKNERLLGMKTEFEGSK